MTELKLDSWRQCRYNSGNDYSHSF